MTLKPGSHLGIWDFYDKCEHSWSHVPDSHRSDRNHRNHFYFENASQTVADDRKFPAVRTSVNKKYTRLRRSGMLFEVCAGHQALIITEILLEFNSCANDRTY